MTTSRRPSGATGKSAPDNGGDSPMKRFEKLARGLVSVRKSEIQKQLRKPVKKKPKKRAAP